MQTEIGKWGNSLALRIPSHMAKELGVVLGTKVELDIQSGHFVVAPVAPRKRYTLKEMVDSLPAEPEGEIGFGVEVGNEIVEW